MKNVVMLLLVLALAGYSYAGVMDLKVYVNGAPADVTGWAVIDGAGTIGVYSSKAEGYATGGGIYLNLTNWPAGGMNGDVAFDTSNLTTVYYPANGTSASSYTMDAHNVWINNTNTNVQAGLQFEIPVTALSNGSMVARIYSYDAAGVFTMGDSISLWVTPEPATMSMLALGGLALLRRKRA